MSDTPAPSAAPRFDMTVLLKYLAGGGLMAMLFALTVLGRMSAEAFETLAVGALGAIGGHAAGALGKGP